MAEPDFQPPMSELTWSQDRINTHDVEYIRADVAEQRAMTAAEEARALTLGKEKFLGASTREQIFFALDAAHWLSGPPHLAIQQLIEEREQFRARAIAAEQALHDGTRPVAAVPAGAAAEILSPLNACSNKEHCRSLLRGATVEPVSSTVAEVVKEACARTCDELAEKLTRHQCQAWQTRDCAKAIRALDVSAIVTVEPAPQPMTSAEGWVKVTPELIQLAQEEQDAWSASIQEGADPSTSPLPSWVSLVLSAAPQPGGES